VTDSHFQGYVRQEELWPEDSPEYQAGNDVQKLGEAKKASGEPSLLLWLLWRLGWECGVTVRALHDANVSWGTYRDSMGVHCNAHVNNFVVKPPSVKGSSTFLAPLDFDMAFTRENYLPEVAERHAAASVGLDSWEQLLNFEATMGMKTVLAGDDFASTGVSNAVPVAESHSVVAMAMRDTLVAAYDAARSKGADNHPCDARMHSAAEELVKLALCLVTQVEG